MASACDLFHGGVIVISEPYAGDEAVGEAYEPCVAAVLGCSGFTCGIWVSEIGASSCAVLDNALHHAVEYADGIGADGAFSFGVVFALVIYGAVFGDDFGDAEWCDHDPAIGDGGVCAGQFEWGDLVCAQSEAEVFVKLGCNAEAAGGVDNGGGADIFDELVGDGVEGEGQGLGQCDFAVIFFGEVFGAVAAFCNFFIGDEVIGFPAMFQCGEIGEWFE